MNSVNGWSTMKIVAISATATSFILPVYSFVKLGNKKKSKVYSSERRGVVNETEGSSQRTDLKVVETNERDPEIKVLNID